MSVAEKAKARMAAKKATAKSEEKVVETELSVSDVEAEKQRPDYKVPGLSQEQRDAARKIGIHFRHEKDGKEDLYYLFFETGEELEYVWCNSAEELGGLGVSLTQWGKHLVSKAVARTKHRLELAAA